MTDIRCGCGRMYSFEERLLGRTFKCRNSACGRIIRIEIQEDNEPGSLLQEVVNAIAPLDLHRERMHRDRRIGLAILAAGSVLLFAWLLFRSPNPEPTPEPKAEPTTTVKSEPYPTPLPELSEGDLRPIPLNPAEVKERKITEQAAAKPGDPELSKEYQEVNEQYFDNKLPAIPVLWEPRLGEIGPLKAEGFTEEGLWRTLGDKAFILLNPLFSQDAAETRRVLCHEVVHEYLYSIGDKETNHGPKFQAVLRRLSDAGAFKGIPASEEEKSSLRSRVGAESVRLEEESAWIKREKYELDQTEDAIDREAIILDREVHELNHRISNANEQGDGWPSDDEIESSKARGRFHDQRVVDLQGRMVDFNTRVDGYNAAVAQFNRTVNRYNLMMAYPDGLNEESTMHAKTPVDRR